MKFTRRRFALLPVAGVAARPGTGTGVTGIVAFSRFPYRALERYLRNSRGTVLALDAAKALGHPLIRTYRALERLERRGVATRVRASGFSHWQAVR